MEQTQQPGGEQQKPDTQLNNTNLDNQEAKDQVAEETTQPGEEQAEPVKQKEAVNTEDEGGVENSEANNNAVTTDSGEGTEETTGD